MHNTGHNEAGMFANSANDGSCLLFVDTMAPRPLLSCQKGPLMGAAKPETPDLSYRFAILTPRQDDFLFSPRLDILEARDFHLTWRSQLDRWPIGGFCLRSFLENRQYQSFISSPFYFTRFPFKSKL